MIQASGTIIAPLTCTDSTGAPTTPTGTPTYTLVKNGTDTATTGNCSGSAAQWYASATVPGDAAIGDRFWFKVSAVISGTTYTANTAVQTVGVFQTGDSFARIGAAGAGLTAIGDTRLANLDAAITSRAATGAAMTLTSGERITLAGAIEAGFLDDMTGGAFLAGVMAQIESLFDSGADVPVVTIADTVAGAVRMELATELARLDAAVSSRPTAAAIRSEIDSNSTQLAKIGTPAGASVSADIAAIKTDTGNLTSRITANLFSGITYLKNWLGIIAGKTADATTLAEINATTAGATYANTTDSLEAIRDNTGSGGITTGDIEDIVDGISEALTAPGFAASVSIQEGTYATVADVESRLSAYGVTNLADMIDPDGTRDSQELGLVEVAIEYANSVIDEHIVDLLHNSAHRVQTTFTRPSGNAWLRDRCVDIACYRIATLGGRSPSDVLRFDYDSALDRLAKARNQQIRIPHLQYTAPTRPYAMEMGGKPTVVRTRGT